MSLSTTTMSGHLCSITWSIWIFMSQRIFALCISMASSAICWFRTLNVICLTETPVDSSGNFVVSLLVLQLHHTHTQPFYGSVEFVRENPGEPVPEETFTHYSHRSHQSSLLQLHQFTTFTYYECDCLFSVPAHPARCFTFLFVYFDLDCISS